MNKLVAVFLLSVCAPLFLTPVYGQYTDSCEAADIVNEVDRLYEEWAEYRHNLSTSAQIIRADFLNRRLTAYLDYCASGERPELAELESDDSGIAQSIQLDTQEYGIVWNTSKKTRMENNCELAYVPSDHDSSILAVVLFGEDTIRQAEIVGLYDSKEKELAPDLEQESAMGGTIALISAYTSPKHREEYTLHYAFNERIWETTVKFEMGVTGKRKTLGVLGIAC